MSVRSLIRTFLPLLAVVQVAAVIFALEHPAQAYADPESGYVFLHFPEQKHGVTIAQPLNSLVQHKILRGMILGNTWDELQLERWIAEQS